MTVGWHAVEVFKDVTPRADCANTHKVPTEDVVCVACQAFVVLTDAAAVVRLAEVIVGNRIA